jgi:hypothetical protein
MQKKMKLTGEAYILPVTTLASRANFAGEGQSRVGPSHARPFLDSSHEIQPYREHPGVGTRMTIKKGSWGKGTLMQFLSSNLVPRHQDDNQERLLRTKFNNAISQERSTVMTAVISCIQSITAPDFATPPIPIIHGAVTKQDAKKGCQIRR